MAPKRSPKKSPHKAKRKTKKKPHGNSSAVNQRTRQAEFIEAFAVYGNIVRACLETEIPRRTVYNWKARNDKDEYVDPDFMRLYEVARKEAVEALEMEAWHRAVEGDETPMTVAGKRVDVYRKSDTLLIFLLKAHDPKYRDRYDVNMSGEIEHTGQVTLYMPDNGRGPGGD